MLVSLMRVTTLNRSILFNFLFAMAKIKDNYSSTTEIVVKSILAGKNIDATKVAEILTSLGLDLEKILRASLYFTGEIEKPVPQCEVIDDKGRTLHLTDYDFLANTVRFTYTREATRWFRTEEDANRWLADKDRNAYAGYETERDPYHYSATAEVEISNSMSYDAWDRLALVKPNDDIEF